VNEGGRAMYLHLCGALAIVLVLLGSPAAALDASDPSWVHQAVAEYAYDAPNALDGQDDRLVGLLRHQATQRSDAFDVADTFTYDASVNLARNKAQSIRYRSAPNTADDLAAAANRASGAVGPGSGAVHGTRVHSAFATELRALGRSDVFSEVSSLQGRVVPYGTRGSVRLDAVVGSPGAPTAIFDLKTGAATLSSTRIAQIRSHLPPGFQDIPVQVLRP
jgi:hypothetical protein